MGYYMGDFYAGARGDPGIGSFFGGLLSKAVSFIPGIGPVASGAIDVARGGLAKRALGGAATAGRAIIAKGTGIIMKHPVISAAGAAGAVAAGGFAAGRRGRAAVTVGGHRRHKRMNVCNPRALRRAIRRTHSFAKLAMHTIHLVHPKKKVRFGGFRRKKAKR